MRRGAPSETAPRSTSTSQPARFTPGGFGQTIQFARASTASFHDASGVMQTAAIDQPRIDHDRGTGLVRGLLVENARTNLLLNAAIPVTQTVSVTAALHALSFWGTGTITRSDAHSASLTGPGGSARAVLVFTPAAGALTLTVSGDVQMAQLEAGNCATSFIPTAGAPSTRLADRPVVPFGSWWNPDEGTILAEWQDINQQSGNTRVIGLPGSRSVLSLSAATGTGAATGANAATEPTAAPQAHSRRSAERSLTACNSACGGWPWAARRTRAKPTSFNGLECSFTPANRPGFR